MFTWKYDNIKPFGNLLKECVFFAARQIYVQDYELILHIPFVEIQNKRHLLERPSLSFSNYQILFLHTMAVIIHFAKKSISCLTDQIVTKN